MAVIVSLYLARRDRKIRLEVSAGHRLLITPGQQGNPPEYLAIKIVNIGHREVQISNIGWKVGFLKKKYGVQAVIQNDGISNAIPVRLRDGDTAEYFIPLNAVTNWLNSFVDKFLMPYPSIRSRFVKIQVFTSVGKSFEAPIETGLREKLLEEIKKRS